MVSPARFTSTAGFSSARRYQDYRAVLVGGEEHGRVAAEHPIPIVIKFLMGFAPRHFMRLDPVAAEPAAEEPPMAVGEGD